MAYFEEASRAVVTALLSFPVVTENTLQIFKCKNGEQAGFKIVGLAQTDGTSFQVSQVYDVSSGSPVLLGSVSVVPGLDLCAGMFSSGCWCNADPLVEGTKFFQADYL